MHVAATGVQGSGPTEELAFDYQQFTTLAGADTFCWDFTVNHSC